MASDEGKLSPSFPPGGDPRDEVVTLLIPSWVFLRDDLGSLLLACGDRRADDWLGVLLVPESPWTPGELAIAARYLKKWADMAAVVWLREPPAGLALPSVPPEAALETLCTTLRLCPAGGTVILAWPGSTETGLTVLRKARQRVLAAEPREAPGHEPSADTRTTRAPFP